MSIAHTNINLLPKVSVIVPIYNTESYLRQALDSISKQSLLEIEIILINDGSTDNSQSIIKEYSQKDSRIQWIKQVNQGVSVARNAGLRLATGKYIYFMDSDDSLDINTLKQCYDKCEIDKLDFVFFDAEIINEEEIADTFSYCRKGKICENKLWNGLDLLQYKLEHSLFIVSPCLYFVSQKFIKTYFSGFPPGIIHEDHVFAMQIMLNAHRIRYIAQPYFKRRVRAKSIMTNSFSMRNIDGYALGCTQIRYWSQQHKEWTSIINLYLVKTLNSVVWLAHQMTFLEKVETMCRFKRLHLSQYITLKNWIAFWLKRHKT